MISTKTHDPALEDDVLAAVVDLSNRYRAPSTSLIVWRLAGSAMITSAFQAGVANALQRLLSEGRVACVTHRGTRRWSASGPAGRPPA